jgi:PAS domain S-box-containing protein
LFLLEVRVNVSADAIEWLLQSHDPATLVMEAAEIVLHECGCDASALLLVNETDQLELSGWFDHDQINGFRPPMQLLELLSSDAIRTNALVHSEHDEGFRLGLAVPLRHSMAPHPLGALVLLWRSSTIIGHAVQEQVTLLARYLTIALANARRHTAREHERKHHAALIDQIGDALIIIDAETLLIEQSNRAAEALCGYSAVDLNGRAIEGLVSYGRHQRQSLRGVRGHVRIEGELRHCNGSLVSVALHATEIVGERRLVAVCLHNLHEQWRPLQQRMLAERMAGMNHMTAVIAHEINNPLQALSNALQLLGRPLEPEKHTRYLSMAQIEIDRLIRLVRRALDMHRPTYESQRPIAIHTILGEVTEQIATLAGHQRVTITCDIAPGGQWVVGVASHLREVFLSLGLNALEAMPDGGQLTIRVQIETNVAHHHDQIVVIAFTDTGSGIPEERLQEIFEPFYTTKNGNAGLGLAICYSIIEHHVGHLSVRTSEQGTTFQVNLPAISSSDTP